LRCHLRSKLETQNPKPETRNPKSETRVPKPATRCRKSETRNLQPGSLQHQRTRYARHQTRNATCGIRRALPVFTTKACLDVFERVTPPIHQPARLNQMVHFQTSDSPGQNPSEGQALKVRSKIGRFGLIVRAGGLQDTKCDASSFDQYDFMVKSLAGYGLAGKITMQVPFSSASLVICKLGFHQNHFTFTLTLLIEIVMSSTLP